MGSRPVDNVRPIFFRLRRAKHSRPVPHGACGTMIVLQKSALAQSSMENILYVFYRQPGTDEASAPSGSLHDFDRRRSRFLVPSTSSG